MALTFTVEDGSVVSGANSYCSVADADSYHDGHLYRSTWTNAGSTKKQEALVMATRLLDEHVDWLGSIADINSPLRWPRVGVHNRDHVLYNNNTIPTELKNATAEFARLLIDADLTAEPDTKGFKSLSVGVLDLEVDKFDRVGVIPRSVADMLNFLGEVRGAGSASMTTPLVRS